MLEDRFRVALAACTLGALIVRFYNIGASMTRTGFINIVRNPQNSVGNYLGPILGFEVQGFRVGGFRV